MNGTLVRDDDAYVITVEQELAHPVEAVWARLVSPDDLAQWIGPGTIQPGLGGVIRIRIGAGDADEHLVRSVITAWDPPSTLAFVWGGTAWNAGPVRFALGPQGASTRLVFMNRHPLASRDTIQSAIAAWDYALQRFASLLDGTPQPFDLDRMGRIRTGYETVMNAEFGSRSGL
jgi:uncharacterized protein YndB with AHSA1/START domain